MVNFDDSMRVNEWVRRNKTMIQMNKQTLPEIALQCARDLKMRRVSVTTMRQALTFNQIEYRGGKTKRQMDGLKDKVKELKETLREARTYMKGEPEHLRSRIKDLLDEVIEIPVAI